MADRFDQAAALRLSIWQWMTDHPRSSMEDILSAFVETNTETVRKAVILMRKNFNVAKVGVKGLKHFYSATAIAPPTADDARRRIRTGAGHNTEASAAKAKRVAEAAKLRMEKRLAKLNEQKAKALAKSDEAAKAARLVEIKAARLAGKIAAEEKRKAKAKEEAEANTEPWRYIHRGGEYNKGKLPVNDQRGQGAARPRVYVNSFHLF